MSYERITKPEGYLYHYTKRDNLDNILQDGHIRRMGDIECWFSTSLEDILTLMHQTVMMEGKPYYGLGGVLRHYPAFVPEDYVILKLEPRFQSGDCVRWNQEFPPSAPPELLAAGQVFSSLKVGFRGDLKFREHPEIIEVAPLILEQALQQNLTM